MKTERRLGRKLVTRLNVVLVAIAILMLGIASTGDHLSVAAAAPGKGLGYSQKELIVPGWLGYAIYRAGPQSLEICWRPEYRQPSAPGSYQFRIFRKCHNGARLMDGADNVYANVDVRWANAPRAIGGSDGVYCRAGLSLGGGGSIHRTLDRKALYAAYPESDQAYITGIRVRVGYIDPGGPIELPQKEGATFGYIGNCGIPG